MFFKRRWFKILALLSSLVAFIGYFAFSTFLFAPHEGAWEFDITALIPRDVDYFVAKADLAGDFGEFPRLAVMDQVGRLEAWKTLEAAPAFGAWKERVGVDEGLAQLESQLSQLPLGIEPLQVFGGRDLALAGIFGSGPGAQSEWAAYGRLSWAGKLAIAALRYPGVLGLEAQGITVTEEQDALRLSGAQLPNPIYVSRVKDVGIFGTSPRLVRGAAELERRSGEGSLYLSADYGDRIDSAKSRGLARDELEVLVDVRKLLGSIEHQGDLPNPNSQQFATSLLGRLFQVPACKKLMGVVGFDQGLSADVHVEFSSELISDAQHRIYSQGGFDHTELLERIATGAPADCVMFAYLEGPLEVLLGEIFRSAEPALRSNLEDAFRSTGRFSDLKDVIGHVSSSLHNRLALVVRPNDYSREEQRNRETGLMEDTGPPNDGTPVFALTLITWYSDESKIIELRNLVGEHPKQFGLQGRDGESGYYRNSISNYETREFWSRFIPGTGVIATMNTHDRFLISNVHEMLRHLHHTSSTGGDRYPRLSNRPDFMALLQDTVASANAVVWFNPRAAEGTLRAQAENWAAENAAAGINWTQLRSQEEIRLIPKMFPGKTRSRLTSDEKAQLSVAVDSVLREYRNEKIRENTPQLVMEKGRLIEYLKSCSAMLAMLRLDPRSFDLSLRVVTPLAE